MKTEIFNGREFARGIDAESKRLSERFKNIRGRKPLFAIVDPSGTEEASIYGRSKIKKANNLDIEAVSINVPQPENNFNPLEYLENTLKDLNPDGIIVERPLPKWINPGEIENIVPDYLDVEGANVKNMGRNIMGERVLIPATADAAMRIIESLGDRFGKHVCIVNRSNIIGRPLAAALLNRDYTVSVCHSKTENLREITSRSDVVVTATGKAGYLGKDYIKEGAAVIDVGLINTDNGVTGDCVQEELNGYAAFLTPVPGGVGPVTTSVVMNNFMKLAMERIEDRLKF
ncbi:bifunctional 5,10-methylenetetrahydrofolate dehydrogenase/5,10-methenyltetrahydrofolate cyclohydrolase [Cuniculiplasma sp. SKW3]|uniref:bifunctional 5,10-methylenetetrahydrofolate dehydrogenase/5,10-methenyltetrahydrofolate cyclohydrolase n=1 Tax=Cuniculiplasma sp. SKW3 TaxID=3400170 RepID=UPI003FD63FCE